jgi:hypothetical protein
MRSQKKAAVAPATPKAESGDEVPPTPATETKKTPRKRATPKVFHKLSTALSGAAPVDVSFENDTVHGKVRVFKPNAVTIVSNNTQVLAKEAGFGQTIKLTAPQQFELVASYMLDNGLQAIVIKPSAPFPFLKLPAHLRARILRLNLTPTTNKGRIELVTEGKSGSVRAKDYLKESKHRTAMATLNKQVSRSYTGPFFVTSTNRDRVDCCRGPPYSLRLQVAFRQHYHCPQLHQHDR